jgi:hypothetical protein
MAIAPTEFYRLQYSELVLMLTGYHERVARERENLHREAAWLGHLFLLPYTPKDHPVLTPGDLLGLKPRKQRGAPVEFGSAHEAASAFFAARKARLKKERNDG